MCNCSSCHSLAVALLLLLYQLPLLLCGLFDACTLLMLALFEFDTCTRVLCWLSLCSWTCKIFIGNFVKQQSKIKIKRVWLDCDCLALSRTICCGCWAVLIDVVYRWLSLTMLITRAAQFLLIIVKFVLLFSCRFFCFLSAHITIDQQLHTRTQTHTQVCASNGKIYVFFLCWV